MQLNLNDLINKFGRFVPNSWSNGPRYIVSEKMITIDGLKIAAIEYQGGVRKNPADPSFIKSRCEDKRVAYLCNVTDGTFEYNTSSMKTKDHTLRGVKGKVVIIDDKETIFIPEQCIKNSKQFCKEGYISNENKELESNIFNRLSLSKSENNTKFEHAKNIDSTDFLINKIKVESFMSDLGVEQKDFGKTNITLQSRFSAKKFYEDLGFVRQEGL